MKYSKWIITLIIALNVLFSIAVLAINAAGHDVSDALIQGFFTFTCVELVSLTAIKTAKVVKKERGNTNDTI